MSVASQDVYLNLNTPVSVVGSGGGGGSVPANLVVSTIFSNGNTSTIGGAYVSGIITTDGGAGSGVRIGNTFITATGGSTMSLLANQANSVIIVKCLSTNLTGPDAFQSQVLVDGNLNVSSINGAAVGGAASVPANLVVSTLTAATSVSVVGNYSLPAIRVAGASGPDFSTLVVNGGLDLLLQTGLGSTIMTKVNGNPSQVAIPGNLFVSSINGTSWNYITSTLLGLSP